MIGIPEQIVLSPCDWPAECRAPRPGDLEAFVPQGFGLGAPAILTPYGGPASNSYYGFDAPNAHPILAGPLTEPAGGTLYFDDGAEPETLTAALSLMGVYQSREFAAFAVSSTDPVVERYLDQMRFVTSLALSGLFGAAEPAPPQSLTIPEAMVAFVAAQKTKWNGPGSAFSWSLAGTAGGDGDWAKESLAFGVHLENTYWGVYRIWSRAWLVTK